MQGGIGYEVRIVYGVSLIYVLFKMQGHNMLCLGPSQKGSDSSATFINPKELPMFVAQTYTIFVQISCIAVKFFWQLFYIKRTFMKRAPKALKFIILIFILEPTYTFNVSINTVSVEYY
jgi:hypothetical protein